MKKRKHRSQKTKRREKPKIRPKVRSSAPGRPAPVQTGGPGPDVIALAGAALRNGDPHNAFGLCQDLLATEPQNADALNLAGVAAFQVGLAEDAVYLLKLALACAPQNAEALTNLGNVLGHLDRTDEAEQAYCQAMAADPAFAEGFFNFAALMENTSRHEESAVAYEQTLQLAPGHALAYQGLANTLKARGRLEEAKSGYQSALDRNPALATARTNLAAVLHELGDFDCAAEHCRRALKDQPNLIEARFNLGLALQELGRFEDSIAAYDAVLTRQPKHAAAAMNAAYALQRLGRLPEAGKAFERTLVLDRDLAKAAANLADLRLEQGDPAAALAVTERFLDHDPGNTEMLACKALILGDVGREAEARKLVDFKRFLWTHQMPPPHGYENLDEFNTLLAGHLLAHPTLTRAPRSHATRNGLHSGELLDPPKGPLWALKTMILGAADHYCSDVGQGTDHPFLARRPDRFEISIWGVVLEATGHQLPHIHPAAWLSGVYYVEVPDIVTTKTPGQAGWIEFGQPPGHFHNRSQPETKTIQPAPGLMVLFPSYFYHRTIPFETNERRISIAFDLMPGGQVP